jgi:hypothetical protein
MAIAALAAIISLSATARASDPNKPPSKEAKIQAPPKPVPGKPAAPPKRTPASFTRDMPFGEAMDILRNSTTPPLNIVVLWKEIGENAGIYRETPIGFDGIPGLRTGQYLELLLLSLSGSAPAKLGCTIKDGIITVGTTGSLRASKKVTRVYDVSDLVAEPARYFFPPMGFGGMGYNAMYGGPMMGQTGTYGAQSLSNATGNLYTGTQQPNSRRR